MPGILKILPAFHTGGVEQSTLIIANYLAAQGLESFVASSGGSLEKKLHPDVTHITLTLHTKNPFKMIGNALKLKRLITQHDIKVIHAGSRAPAWSAYLAAKAAGIPYVTTYHGAYSQNFLKWHYNQVMAWGTPVIVSSAYMENHVERYYPGTKCVTIPSGIDTSFFAQNLEIDGQSQQLKHQWNVPVDGKVILLVGRFTRIKGHEFLLSSLAYLKIKKAPVVIFVGDSSNPNLINELKQQAKAAKIQLFFHLDEPDLRPFYHAADVVVVPTTKPESFGRVTVEAMSMGKIVIGNDLGASSELINDPRWIFDHSTTTSLADKIHDALSLPPAETQAIGQQNRERAIALYDIEKLVVGYLEIYHRLLKAAAV